MRRPNAAGLARRPVKRGRIIMGMTRSMFVAMSAAVVAAGGWLLQGHAGAAPGAGTVEHIKVHGASLEGNLEGDSADPEVTVYAPPSYASERTRRYPVLYLMHGYGGTDGTWTGRLAKLPESADKLAAAGGLHELIVVMPNAYSLHKGSM